MKDRISFLVITTKTGIQKRFSVNKYLLYLILLLFLVLLGSGILGAWKYKENIAIQKKCQLLKAKKVQLETIARTVKDIEKKEALVRQQLGLQVEAEHSKQEKNDKTKNF